MTRAERLARNEAAFRSVNEHIRDAAEQHGTDGHTYEFVCECSNPACVERIMLTLAEYEAIRASGTRFVLAMGHQCAEVEAVVAEDADHVVVEKLGEAGRVADALDPRAA